MNQEKMHLVKNDLIMRLLEQFGIMNKKNII